MLMGGQWTCDSQVAGSSPGWASLHSGLGQVLITEHVTTLLYYTRHKNHTEWATFVKVLTTIHSKRNVAKHKI